MTRPFPRVNGWTNASTLAANTGLREPAVTGQRYTVKDGKGDAAANNITITPGTGTINGAATYVINTNYGVVTFVFDGTNWQPLN